MLWFLAISNDVVHVVYQNLQMEQKACVFSFLWRVTVFWIHKIINQSAHQLLSMYMVAVATLTMAEVTSCRLFFANLFQKEWPKH